MSKQDTLSPSTRQIEAAILSVPRGRVSTYGEIALAAGLPWFRILAKGKKAGTARVSLEGEGFAEQRALLAAEGVESDEDGIVDLVRFGYPDRSR